MPTYLIYIKSHTEAPDFENEVQASNRIEAIDKFYQLLHGEFDKKFINENIEESNLSL